MRRYDPEQTPDPEEWLSLDEQERIELVEAFHRSARIKLPNAKLHATFHVIVENQLAEELPSVTRAIPRLQGEGLSRHDALHAIGWVLAQHFFELMNASQPDGRDVAQARYDAAVERLDSATWLAQGDS